MFGKPRCSKCNIFLPADRDWVEVKEVSGKAVYIEVRICANCGHENKTQVIRQEA